MTAPRNFPQNHRAFSWKTCYFLSLGILPVLIVLNFYGLYSNRFYFLKIDNYIFPLFSLLHFVFLYVMRFKIREGEYPDPVMRNVEYGMYAVLMIYLFKCFDTLPIGVLTLVLQVFLVVLTLLSFWYRKALVGGYDFEQIDENLNSWQ